MLPLFEDHQPADRRPRDAIEIGHAWIRGEVSMGDAHKAAFQANAAGKGTPDPVKYAAQARVRERDWQREQIPAAVRDLVLDDQQRRSAICWNVFDD